MNYPSREEIRDLCTEQSFERGVNYYHQGRIQELDVDGGTVEATVRGSSEYDVSIDVEDDAVRTYCSCPYDYAGDCKHVVAVLLAVDEQSGDTTSETADGPQDRSTGAVDVEALVEQTPAADLRTFLLDVLEDDPDVRDRFVAFTGEDTCKTVYDYKQEVDRLFDDAAGRGGFVEYGTWVDFSQHHDLAQTHRERGRAEAATDVYRALAESIRENYDRVDDSSGHYGQELERAVDAYAETVAERGLGHEEKRPYIEYLVGEFVDADYGFASDQYDDALRTLCTTRADLEYWLDLLDDHVSGVSLEPAAMEERATSAPDSEQSERAGNRTENGDDTSADGDRAVIQSTGDRDRADEVLYASDFTDGPLTLEDFTGETLDVEHVAVGPLELGYFVGDAFEELRVDEPTTVEEHTVDVDPTGSSSTGTEEGSDSTGTAVVSSVRKRNVLSTYIHLLEELDEEAALVALYEEIYLESSRFCKQYAERLVEEGDEERALEVVEDGIRTFRPPTGLRWLATELYQERDPDEYRDTLKRLFLDHSEWDAYDELKEECDEREWASTYEQFEQRFDGSDRKRLLAMYVHEGDLENAFAELKGSESLSLFRRYRDPVAAVDPVEYFESYRDLLVPFAAGETGRRHYREVADHLEEMQGLVPDERFEEFVDFLKEKHSNRPAFLDELEKAGF